jgi:DNA end-binding protein Ku
MRAIWKGAISFGLVTVPVKVYSATEDHDVPLHQVHDEDGGRIRYERHCEIDGKKIPFEHISRAYEEGGRTVVLTDDELHSLPEERSREIEVVEFIPAEQLDPIMFDRAYFLEPEKTGVKPYQLLVQTLEREERTAITTVTLRNRTRLAALRVRGDVLVMQTLLWSDEVREAAFPSLDETPKISDRELKMASSLVDQLASDFDPSEFQDEYQVQLRQLVEAKLEQGDALDTAETFGEKDEEEKSGGEVLDLMEALRRSVERSRSAAGSKSAGTDDDAEADEEPAAKEADTDAPARKTAARKAPAKKASAPAKKAPAKKPASAAAKDDASAAAKKDAAKPATRKPAAKKKAS